MNHLISFLKKIWLIKLNVGYLILINVIAYFILSVPDQSKDFVLAIVNLNDTSYIILLLCATFLWSWINWYSARIILEASPSQLNLFVEGKLFYVSYIFGALPFLSMATVFGLSIPNVDHKETARNIALAFIAIGIAAFFIYKWYREFTSDHNWPNINEVVYHLNRKDIEDGVTIIRGPKFKEEISFISKHWALRTYFFYMGITIGISFLILCFPDICISFSSYLKPAVVVIFSICIYTYVFTVLYYFHDVKSRPFVIIFILYYALCSNFNDNTEIPTTVNLNSKFEKEDFRLTPSQAFTRWMDARLTNSPDTNSNKPYPVFFIATQGGGIRGELWTITALHSLDIVLPGFKDHIFCMGGASGGTVGATFFTAYLHDKKQFYNDTSNYSSLLKFAKEDCISPVIMSFAFGENLQRLMPFEIQSVERAKILMKTFSERYSKYLSSSILDSSFLNAYYPDYSSLNYNTELPSLLINGTLAETGQRVVTSNLKIHQADYFKYDYDCFHCMRADISFSTAALNCMRFPLLLSGGSLYKENKCNLKGHIVDGGYEDNTGLQAMLNLIAEMKDSLKSRNAFPVLIYLRNGASELNENETETKTKKFLQDINLPLKALINVNGTSTPALNQMNTAREIEGAFNTTGLIFQTIWLKDTVYESNVILPLGLYISETAAVEIKQRADSIPVKYDKFINKMKAFMK